MSALLTPARSLYRRLRTLTVGALHPERRRRAIERLTILGRPSRVLAICHGNVCRSPYLAAILQRDLEAGIGMPVSVDSAGFVGPGRGAPPRATAVARRHGVDLSPHASKLVTSSLVALADLVLVMDTHQAREIAQLHPPVRARTLVLGDLDPVVPATRTIRDPWNGDERDFDESFTRIDRCVQTLIDTMRNTSASPRFSPSDD